MADTFLNVLSAFMPFLLQQPGGRRGCVLVFYMTLGEVTEHPASGGELRSEPRRPRSARALGRSAIPSVLLESAGSCFCQGHRSDDSGRTAPTAGCREACLGSHLSHVDIPSSLTFSRNNNDANHSASLCPGIRNPLCNENGISLGNSPRKR